MNQTNHFWDNVINSNKYISKERMNIFFNKLVSYVILLFYWVMWELQSHEALQTKYKQWYNNYTVIDLL